MFEELQGDLSGWNKSVERVNGLVVETSGASRGCIMSY